MDPQLNIPKSKSWKMFDQIAPQYDRLNHLLSFGMHGSWRRKFLQFLPQNSGQSLLDLATGTGDVVISLTQNNPKIKTAYGIDLADKMLDVARKKVSHFGLNHKITLKHGDINAIPFSDNSFDCTTIAFGIRNVEDPNVVLKEMHRVLKKGGRGLVLEFSLPQNFFIRGIHLFYLLNIVPLIGWIASGHYGAYKYLSKTIPVFPYGNEFASMMYKQGFVTVTVNPLCFGVASIYVGEK